LGRTRRKQKQVEDDDRRVTRRKEPKPSKSWAKRGMKDAFERLGYKDSEGKRSGE